MTRSTTDEGVRAIAYYLPQFHPIPENDAWWGQGFTEWTNTARAKPLYRGHYQPHVPADLGFYDLRLPECRQAQADLARQYGVEAFCYYHYWFGNGRRLLERPFQEVLSSGEPDFGFCLCWANETWTGIWHGLTSRILVEQSYPGREDAIRHFESLVPAFHDERYVTVHGMPLFLIYRPTGLPDARGFADLWRERAVRAGLPGMHLVGIENEPWQPEVFGFDAATTHNVHLARWSDGGRVESRFRHWYRRLRRRPPLLFDYEEVIERFVLEECRRPNVYPCAIPNWDNTPRSGRRGLVLHGSTPELFRRHLRNVLTQVRHKPSEQRLVFIKSWNEWAEGNHLEPDLKFGRGYLKVLHEELTSRSARIGAAACSLSNRPDVHSISG